MKNKIICVSCFKAIKTKNLNKHYRTKTHIRNAKQMKITFDPDIVEEDLKYISMRQKLENAILEDDLLTIKHFEKVFKIEKEISEMELNEKIEEARNEMNNRMD